MDALNILKESLNEVYQEKHAEATALIEASRAAREAAESEPMHLKPKPQPDALGSIRGVISIDSLLSDESIAGCEAIIAVNCHRAAL